MEPPVAFIQTLRRSWPFLVKTLISLGLLGWLFTQIDAGAVLSRLRQMDLRWAALAIALYAVMIVASAWRWQLLLETQEINATMSALTASWLVATFFNNFLPSNIGGDVVRIADTARLTASRTVAATVVLLDRALGLVALLLVAACGSVMAGAAGLAVPGGSYLWIAAVGMVAAGTPALFVPELVPRLLKPICRLRPGLFEQRLERLADTLWRLRARPLALAMSFAGAVFVQLVLIGFFLAAARSVGTPLPVLYGLVIVPISLVLQMVPISINGFGVREAVFSYFFVQLGLGADAGIALSLVSAFLIMLFSLSGGLVFLGRRTA